MRTARSAGTVWVPLSAGWASPTLPDPGRYARAISFPNAFLGAVGSRATVVSRVLLR